MKYLSTLLCVPLLAFSATVTREFTDNGAELSNPGMGFVFHYYDNSLSSYGSKTLPEDMLEDWPGLTQIYLRLPWSVIEPEEGKFNWTVLDTPMQRYIKRGLKVSLRISCSETGFAQATPKWVQDAGAKGDYFTPGKGKDPNHKHRHWEPHFDDPVFLEKLDVFLGKLAERYDGHPDVELIDIGSYGAWGEGHTWTTTRNAYPSSVVKKHIDLYKKHFKKTIVLAQDDFLSRPAPFVSRWKRGGIGNWTYDMVVPNDLYGKQFKMVVAINGKKGLNETSPGRIFFGTLTIDAQGVPSFTPVETGWDAAAPLPSGVDFSVVCNGLDYDALNRPHSLKIPVLARCSDTLPPETWMSLELQDAVSGKRVVSLPPEKEDDDLNTYMAESGCGLRDDSIMVAGPPHAYYHAKAAQAFWRNAPIYIESEHYGGSKRRGCWRDGFGFLQSIRDYHASYASIHWWPDVFLKMNRELIRQINREIGYRFLPARVTVSRRNHVTGTFSFETTWQNRGVAPSYVDYYPCITLKNAAGGIAAVFVDEQFNLRNLPVALFQRAETRSSSMTSMLPPNMAGGTFKAFISVGDRLGRPLVELPIEGGDGDRRYYVGDVSFLADYGIADISGEVKDGNLELRVTWNVHDTHEVGGVQPFLHLDFADVSRLAAAGNGEAVREEDRDKLHIAGSYAGRMGIRLPTERYPDTTAYEVWCGLWRPAWITRPDERLMPDAGLGRRIRLGTVRKGEDGVWRFETVKK